MADCSSNLQNLLHDVFGYSSFRQGQFEASSAVLEGQDVLVRLTTGGGKSICYQLPVLAMGEKCCMVISPLIALINDQVRKHSHGFGAC